MGTVKRLLLKRRDDISKHYTNLQLFSLTLLRILIGWHFLYEGLIKLYSSPAWSAQSYLLGSVGPFAPVFKAMANNPKLLIIINQINIWGLILIGVSLFTGFFSKLFKIFAIAILLLYYFAYPPFQGIFIDAPVEGSYWIVNKNLIEIASIIVLYLFPTSHITGIDRFFQPKTRHHEN